MITITTQYDHHPEPGTTARGHTDRTKAKTKANYRAAVPLLLPLKQRWTSRSGEEAREADSFSPARADTDATARAH